MPNEQASQAPVVLLPFEAALHFEQVNSLYREVFGPIAAQSFNARWRWSQEENLYPENTPRWVLTAGSRVVGFLTTIPQRYRIAGQDVVAHSTADFMVSPAYRFHGLKLIREFFRTCENSVSLDDVPDTLAVLKWMKCTSVGVMHRHVKVLDARLLRSRAAWAARVPDAAFLPINLGLRAFDRALTAGRAGKPKLTPSFDARFDRFSDRLAEKLAAVMVRDVPYLNWRYGPKSPHANRKIGVVVDAAGELEGFVVVCRSGDAEHTGFILDLETLPPGNPDVTAALLRFAVDRLREDGAWSVRYHRLVALSAAPSPLLKQFRFSRRKARHELVVKFRQEAVFRAAKDIDRWSYSFGDSEASLGSVYPLLAMDQELQ